jgi:cytochrome c oxidase subunit I+III
MPQYGFRVLPIVRSRHPLWDQRDLDPADADDEDDPGEERNARLARALADWPRGWRAQITTGTVDAQPMEVFRVVGPSIWPFVLAASMTMISVALIFDRLILTAIAVAISIVALIAWHWPDRVERRGDTNRADDFEREHGIPVNVEGSPVLARWSMLLTILVLAIILTTLLFCYAYLRLDAPQWPPAGADAPDSTPALLAAALLLASAAPLPFANRAIRHGARGPMNVALSASFLLGGAGLAATIVALGRTGFSWDSHAYGSAFFTLGAFLALVVLGGLAMNGQAQIKAWAGHHRTARHRQAIDNVALYGYFVAATAAIVVATLYLPTLR